jgi:hypothetical protein
MKPLRGDHKRIARLVSSSDGDRHTRDILATLGTTQSATPLAGLQLGGLSTAALKSTKRDLVFLLGVLRTYGILAEAGLTDGAAATTATAAAAPTRATATPSSATPTSATTTEGNDGQPFRALARLDVCQMLEHVLGKVRQLKASRAYQIWVCVRRVLGWIAVQANRRVFSPLDDGGGGDDDDDDDGTRHAAPLLQPQQLQSWSFVHTKVLASSKLKKREAKAKRFLREGETHLSTAKLRDLHRQIKDQLDELFGEYSTLAVGCDTPSALPPSPRHLDLDLDLGLVDHHLVSEGDGSVDLPNGIMPDAGLDLDVDASLNTNASLAMDLGLDETLDGTMRDDRLRDDEDSEDSDADEDGDADDLSMGGHSISSSISSSSSGGRDSSMSDISSLASMSSMSSPSSSSSGSLSASSPNGKPKRRRDRKSKNNNTNNKKKRKGAPTSNIDVDKGWVYSLIVTGILTSVPVRTQVLQQARLTRLEWLTGEEAYAVHVEGLHLKNGEPSFFLLKGDVWKRALSAWVNEYRPQFLAALPRGNSGAPATSSVGASSTSDLLFPPFKKSKHAKLRSHADVAYLVARATQRLIGVTVSPHKFRHAMANLLGESGASNDDMLGLARLMGHSSATQTTHYRYQGPSIALERKTHTLLMLGGCGWAGEIGACLRQPPPRSGNTSTPTQPNTYNTGATSDASWPPTCLARSRGPCTTHRRPRCHALLRYCPFRGAVQRPWAAATCSTLALRAPSSALCPASAPALAPVPVPAPAQVPAPAPAPRPSAGAAAGVQLRRP